MRPCEALHSWNWKEGIEHVDSVGPHMFERNYFDCAEYMFDGEFNVAQFKEKMYLYHGSAILAGSVVTYPVGADFYRPIDPFDEKNKDVLVWLAEEIENHSDKSIDELLSKRVHVSSAWFADPKTAALYSKISSARDIAKHDCDENCVFVYETRKPLNILVLDDAYNIGKILNSPSNIVPVEVKDALMSMFSIKAKIPLRTTSNSPFSRFTYPNMVRVSAQNDRVFNEWFCKTLSKRYDGYGATTQLSATPDGGVGRFHLEFAFCNPIDKLKRSYANSRDWQHFSTKIPPAMTNLLEEFHKYETFNVNFHSGHLLEHSIWTMLYSEYIAKKVEQVHQGVDRKIVSFLGLIHDIGKINPNDPNVMKNVTRKRFIYFDQPEHPRVGAVYMQEGKIPKTNPMTMEIESYIDIASLFKEAKIQMNYDEFRKLAALVIDMHWEFGKTVLAPLTQNPSDEMYARVRDEYLNKVQAAVQMYGMSTDSYYHTLYVLMIVSLADVHATQPFPSKANYSQKGTNTVSEFFPYIGNMSKLFRGSDIPEKLNSTDLGERILLSILKDVST